jgi:hypothetical protein
MEKKKVNCNHKKKKSYPENLEARKERSKLWKESSFFVFFVLFLFVMFQFDRVEEDRGADERRTPESAILVAVSR